MPYTKMNHRTGVYVFLRSRVLTMVNSDGPSSATDRGKRALAPTHFPAGEGGGAGHPWTGAMATRGPERGGCPLELRGGVRASLAAPPGGTGLLRCPPQRVA